MAKILVSATNAMVYHFLVPHIQTMVDEGHKVELACTNLEGYDKLLKSKLVGDYNITIHYVRLNRSPFSISNVKGYKDLRKIITNGNFDIISTNEPLMGLATRLAALKAKRKGSRIIYTVHGFHFFKGGPIKNWVLYYPIERFMARYTNTLVTINKEDYNRGQSFGYEQVFYIPGIGLDTLKFANTHVDKTKKRKEISIPQNAIMMLSVGELGKRKNHEVAIRGMAKTKNPNLYYVICGEGNLDTYLEKLTMKLGIEDRVKFLGYRKDISELCKASDIYVFPSQREGLGIGALEGMASGLPLITSFVNGIKDYAEEGKTGFCVDPHDIDGFANAMNVLANNKELRVKMGAYNYVTVEKFDIKNVKKIFKKIYDDQIKLLN